MLIPKIVHVTWKTKDIQGTDTPFFQNCLGNIIRLSPSWDVQISDDTDVEEYLKENLDKIDYDLISNRKIIEKIDVWRLIKLYKEGGVYIDMDRLCNTSLDDIINEHTRIVLPTCADHDFSQDFMMSSPGNPIFAESLELNLQRRYEGEEDIYFLGPQTYMHGVTKAMFGTHIHIESGSKQFEDIRNMLKEVDYIETYREIPPLQTIIYRPESKQIDFNYDIEKKNFYQLNNIKHWTNVW